MVLGILLKDFFFCGGDARKTEILVLDDFLNKYGKEELDKYSSVQ
jgi:hypothetical protein